MKRGGKKLSRSLSARMRRVPADGDAAYCLALERLEEAKRVAPPCNADREPQALARAAASE